jgi:hypothetical protein
MNTSLTGNLRALLSIAALGLLLNTHSAMGAVTPPQTTPAQFDLNAPIERFTLDPACTPPPSALGLSTKDSYVVAATPGNDPFNSNALKCKATIVLNGQTVIIPANTVITFPASFLTPYEAFAYNPRCINQTACTETGLAIQDTKRLPDDTHPASYETSIQGNVVYGADGVGTYIAGIVAISQQDLNNGVGFINFIDYATGELRVGGNIGDPNTGARVKINDPVGRFGRRAGPHGDNGGDTQDIRFAVDDGNPTIFAESGYPLCIPRTNPAVSDDPLCPQANRPIDNARPPVNGVPMHLGSFSMPPAPGVTAPAIGLPANFPPTIGGTDPRQQAPLEIGDHIVYAGTLATDANGSYISAHTITANLGIYTTPGTDPAYVTQEVTIVGVGTASTVAAPAEGRELFKVVGFSTDVARPVDAGKVQVDPCNGAEGFARITTEYPNGSSLDPTGQALLNAPLGRFRTSFVKGTALGISMVPASKEIRTEIQGSTQVTAANGLTTGQYSAPVSEFIFAENLGFGGLPIVPNNFEDFIFLSLGNGPYDLYNPYSGTSSGLNFAVSPIQGQLAPWPGSAAPASVNCTAGQTAPPVIVVNDMTVAQLSAVTLNATASYSPSGATLKTFSWTQTAGPNVMPVATQAVNSSTLNFTAPKNTKTTPIVLTFQLTVFDSNGKFSTKAVNVTVNPGNAVDVVTVPVTPTYRMKDGSWNVTANGSDAAATLSMEAYNGNGVVVLSKTTMTHVNGSNTYTYATKKVISSSLLQGNILNIKITSSKGGATGLVAVSVRTN